MAENNKPRDPETAPILPSGGDYFGVHFILRLFLVALAVTSLVVMVTAKETKLVPVPTMPNFRVRAKAKFTDTPAFIYLVATMSVTALYGIITAVVSLGLNSKPGSATKALLYFVFWDVLLLGIVAAATGASGGVGYVGLKGNSHARWGKICDNFGKYCRHFGASIALSLVASIVLVILIMLSACTIHRRIPK
ncbi:hypothetical protein Tsubulata_009606 [Turnera subulata]|uniref:CASP-like protein n=1 Tax=Turnera subulata TaxID=218843 RepID=A0A9Q0J0C8_9ROSI|nr:hypothetical protein Tsubulata_009606 [Turnera subulata]